MDLRNEDRFNERPWKLPDGITKPARMGDMAQGLIAPQPRARARPCRRHQCRRLRHINWAIFAASGRSTMPFSVTITSIRSAGVTSTTGL